MCQAGHIGPCRFLTAVSASSVTPCDVHRRRLSLNAPTLQELEQVSMSIFCSFDVKVHNVLHWEDGQKD